MKRVLITGADSYIGTSFEKYIKENYPNDFETDTVDMIDGSWREKSFAGYDSVFHVAGIAHIKETKKNEHLYYEINRDLAIETAKKAKSDGVRQFILLSSMSVYGLVVGYITKETPVNPNNAYGKSKAEADAEIKKLEDDNFKFVCLRPPMVYGKGCKGNYQSLRKFALKSPIFPDYKNQRSMVYINNLCEFVIRCIDFESFGLFFPQNSEYINTSDMVRLIAKENNSRIRFTKAFNWIVKITPFSIVKKVFGTLIYEQTDTVGKYQFAESITLTEN